MKVPMPAFHEDPPVALPPSLLVLSATVKTPSARVRHLLIPWNFGEFLFYRLTKKRYGKNDGIFKEMR
ncbi:hypothetical cytosolic protein [Syntrophus aciditrophicus SB]|uniref:Hypothetical cytosolic protein n=1 Tax=Syntrophus aciditrophicus (strain SB) TaxID=56780 RepID=Q2LQ12_SYNAS|nr:hypothetical cytosolic protein [Syntrophus aciditrophicus SB]